MKNNHKTFWRCVECGKPTNVLHEVLFGWNFRQLSIKYNVQVPICPGDSECHRGPHGRNNSLLKGQDYYKMKYLDLLGLDHYQTMINFNCQLDRNRKYLQENKQKGLDYLKSMEI